MDLGLILITGANGLVGTALCNEMSRRGRTMRAAVRTTPEKWETPGKIEVVRIGDIGPTTDWGAALDGVDCVVHLAARTHVTRDTATYPLAEYRRINVEATAALARAAAAARIRRLVFLSSIKANGERTADHPFTENDIPRPEDAYGISKWEAEQALWQISRETGLEIVVLRAPLVYGPGVKGNFLRLMNAVARGVPMPLASVRNRRSLIYAGNLAAASMDCIEHPAAAGKTFLVADDVDVATPELVRAIASALGVPARLVWFPPTLLYAAAALLGKTAAVSRLTGSLQVNSHRIRHELGWRPEYTLKQGLVRTAQWYHARVGASSSTK
jgi:nucleoside-diphosphate-sugar epimerase